MSILAKVSHIDPAHSPCSGVRCVTPPHLEGVSHAHRPNNTFYRGLLCYTLAKLVNGSVADEAGTVGLEQRLEVLDTGHEALSFIGVAYQDLLVGILHYLRGGNHVHTFGYRLVN